LKRYFRSKSLSHDYSVDAEASPARFAEQAHFKVYLTEMKSGARSSEPVFTGLYSTGRKSQSIPGWIDGDYIDHISFPDARSFSLDVEGMDVRLFSLLGELIPSGGSLMVSYSLFSRQSHIHFETKTGLDRGYPPAVTPIGFLLFTAGCGLQFKDWYFAEGGREGPEKLQGFKPSNPQAAKEKAQEMLQELSRFSESANSTNDAITQACLQRARYLVSELRLLSK